MKRKQDGLTEAGIIILNPEALPSVEECKQRLKEIKRKRRKS